MQEGWKCPVCGRINAPFVDHCPCKDVQLPLFPNYPVYPIYPIYQPIYAPYRPWEVIVTCKGSEPKYSCNTCLNDKEDIR